MSVVIGIDVGGSTTKIVGIRVDGDKKELITPQFVRANDPITATYGAFGKFTDENRLSISEIDKIMMTGVGSAYIKHDMYGLDCVRVPEFNCIGKGALYLSGMKEALAVSMGTGTALVHAKAGCEPKYLGGTGVGGGTLLGLSKLMLRAESIEHIEEYAEGGDLEKIDLRIKDLTADNTLAELSRDLTASNFGNVSDLAGKEDIARGVFNLVFESIGMISIFAARQCAVKDIILTGNLTRLAFAKEKFEDFNRLGYGVNFTIPPYSEFSTVIGATLVGMK